MEYHNFSDDFYFLKNSLDTESYREYNESEKGKVTIMERISTLINQVSRNDDMKQITISLKYLNRLYDDLLDKENRGVLDEYTNTFLDVLEFFVNNDEKKVHQKNNNNLLNGFYDYMKGMSELTRKDYLKRVSVICSEEGIKIESLANNIDYYVERYTIGEKKERGADSHNSYKCALKKFAEYIKSNR